MSLLQSKREAITLEQYEMLPEDIRAEVFDGQIYYMAEPSQVHQTISMELATTLRLFPREIRQMIISGKHTIMGITVSGNTGL